MNIQVSVNCITADCCKQILHFPKACPQIALSLQSTSCQAVWQHGLLSKHIYSFPPHLCFALVFLYLYGKCVRFWEPTFHLDSNTKILILTPTQTDSYHLRLSTHSHYIHNMSLSQLNVQRFHFFCWTIHLQTIISGCLTSLC